MEKKNHSHTRSSMCKIHLKGNIIFKRQQAFPKAIAEELGIFLFKELFVTSKQLVAKWLVKINVFLPWEKRALSSTTLWKSDTGKITACIGKEQLIHTVCTHRQSLILGLALPALLVIMETLKETTFELKLIIATATGFCSPNQEEPWYHAISPTNLTPSPVNYI